MRNFLIFVGLAAAGIGIVMLFKKGAGTVNYQFGDIGSRIQLPGGGSIDSVVSGADVNTAAATTPTSTPNYSVPKFAAGYMGLIGRNPSP